MAGFGLLLLLLWQQGHEGNQAIRELGELTHTNSRTRGTGHELERDAQQLRLAAYRVLGTQHGHRLRRKNHRAAQRGHRRAHDRRAR